MPPRVQPPKMAGARCANQARSVRHRVVDPRRESGHRSAPLLLVRPMAAMQPAIRAAGARPHLFGPLRAAHCTTVCSAQAPKDQRTIKHPISQATPCHMFLPSLLLNPTIICRFSHRTKQALRVPRFGHREQVRFRPAPHFVEQASVPHTNGFCARHGPRTAARTIPSRMSERLPTTGERRAGRAAAGAMGAIVMIGVLRHVSGSGGDADGTDAGAPRSSGSASPNCPLS